MKKIALLLCAVLTAGALTACSAGRMPPRPFLRLPPRRLRTKDRAGKDAADTPATSAEEKSG